MLFKVNPKKKNPKYFDWTRSTYYRKSLRTATPLTDMRWVKVLIKQKRGGRWNKKREWSLCERPVVKLLGTSLRQKRDARTQSLKHSHVHTHVMWLLGRCSDRSAQVKGKDNKGSTWQRVCNPNPPTHTTPPTIMLDTILKSFILMLSVAVST